MRTKENKTIGASLEELQTTSPGRSHRGWSTYLLPSYLTGGWGPGWKLAKHNKTIYFWSSLQIRARQILQSTGLV